MFGQKKVNKEAIIAEYLAGGISYRSLGEKYGIDFRIINYWVLKYQGKGRKNASKKATAKPVSSKTDQTPAVHSAAVEQLQKELRAAKLHNTLLNAMIDTAEEQLKINIRKKSGTRQS